jgi:hypothetical protein
MGGGKERSISDVDFFAFRFIQGKSQYFRYIVMKERDFKVSLFRSTQFLNVSELNSSLVIEFIP